ncbi:MAG: PD40 domain-containing protein [Chloroflexi bacterium]|nr:PD40 domain-containing protein [Chloroflexota bacterium]
MKRSFFAAIVALTLAVLACASPLSGSTPASPPNVETVVAATFDALTAPAPTEAGVTPPPSTVGLLPHSMYFIGNDGAGLAQVYRLEKDGKTITQLTFEPAAAESYDVSPIDGSVVYVSDNKLYTVNADGSNRSMIFDGGQVDVNNPFINQVRSPVWSPNGQTIAFGHKGLNFYSIVGGQSNLVLKDEIDDAGNGFFVPREMIFPDKYSPDGSKLIVTLGYYEGASSAVYYVNGGALIRLTGGEGSAICCGETEWTPDGSAFYSANPTFGMFSAGLWRVDAATGEVTALLRGDFDTDPIHFADEPFLAPDGQLYFFHYTMPGGTEPLSRVSLLLTRAGPDGATGQTVLRPETFERMNEALWAPDASFVIVANADVPEIYQGGRLELYYTDGQKSMIPLVPFGMELKWGP